MAEGKEKPCKYCGSIFKKRKRDSESQWEAREFCSLLCSNRAKKPRTSAEDRFWKYVPKLSETACWNWTGSRDHKGYGTITESAGLSPRKAHRVSWEIHFGEIPDGLNVCHACDNPACVNPKHLLLGTQSANAIDMARKGRIHKESLLNLKPGTPGIYGAGLFSVREINNGIC